MSARVLARHFMQKNRKQDETNEVIKGLDLEIKENEFVVLFGPGQCGKTTILNILSGLEPSSAGQVKINGNVVDGPKQDRGGMVFQTMAIFPWLTVMKNVSFGPRMNGMKKKEWKKKSSTLH